MSNFKSLSIDCLTLIHLTGHSHLFLLSKNLSSKLALVGVQSAIVFLQFIHNIVYFGEHGRLLQIVDLDEGYHPLRTQINDHLQAFVAH